MFAVVSPCYCLTLTNKLPLRCLGLLTSVNIQVRWYVTLTCGSWLTNQLLSLSPLATGASDLPPTTEEAELELKHNHLLSIRYTSHRATHGSSWSLTSNISIDNPTF